MRIGIIGLGYVGLTLAITAADNGIDVYGIETNTHIKKCLSKNRAHFFEPQLDALIKRHNNKEFHCVDEFPENEVFDAFVITVGTPLMEGETKPNLDYIKSALKQAIAHVYDGSQLVILRSTVSVGTTRNVVIPFLAEMANISQEDVLVGMCPERTVEGKAIEELTQLPQIVSGNNKSAEEIAVKLFRHLTPYVITVSSIEEAELVKLYCNTYRDMSFALGNAFCMAAQSFGVNGLTAIKHANQGYARSDIALPGFVAGPCLEKDAYILINNMPDSDSKTFIMEGRKYNESLIDLVVSWVNRNKVEGYIALSGIAFKGQPETSDLRGSSSVYIARKLKNLGYKLNLHDFSAMKSDMESLRLGAVYDNIYEACENASLLLVLNNHRKYFELQEDYRIYNNRLKIMDSWGVCRNLYNNDKIDICTLGDFLIKND